MARRTLTELAITKAKPAATGKRYVLWDDVVTGFGVRITDRGHKSYIVMRRLKGHAKPIRRVLSDVDTYSLADARDMARDAIKEIKKGVDPKVREAAEERERQRLMKSSVRAVVEIFLAEHAVHNRTYRETRRIFERYVLPKWGGWPIREVRRRDVVELLDHVAANNGRVMADRVLAHVRKAFNWFAVRDDDFMSPIVKGMARTKPKELKRHRTLTADEIRSIWRAADSVSPPIFGHLVRFLLLTGQRRDEAASMLWADVDDGKSTWTVPASRYKTKRAHLVPLSAPALAVLKSLNRLGAYAFTTQGDVPFQGFSKAKADLDEKSGIADWRIHDVRRTARTLMAEHGVSTAIAERVLGHEVQGVEGTYDQWGYFPEKRHALDVLAGAIDQILNPKRTKKVVALDERRVKA